MKEALEFCRDNTLNDKRSDLTLLYDKNLPEQLVRELAQLKRPRKEGGFGWKKVVPWESFIGGECDTVVYVGSGSLEAFSRARLKLMIITVSPREQRGDTIINFYSYNAGLRNSVKKNLLEKILAKNLDFTVFEDEDSALGTLGKLRSVWYGAVQSKQFKPTMQELKKFRVFHREFEDDLNAIEVDAVDEKKKERGTLTEKTDYVGRLEARKQLETLEMSSNLEPQKTGTGMMGKIRRLFSPKK